MDFIKKNRMIISIVACLVGIIGLFLPFFKVGTSLDSSLNYSFPFIDGDGKIVLVFLVIAGALSITKINIKLILIPVGLALAILIYDGSNLNEYAKKVSDSLIYLKLGIGFYITLIATILTGLIQLVPEDKVVNNNVMMNQYVQPVQPMMNQYNQQENNNNQ